MESWAKSTSTCELVQCGEDRKQSFEESLEGEGSASRGGWHSRRSAQAPRDGDNGYYKNIIINHNPSTTYYHGIFSLLLSKTTVHILPLFLVLIGILCRDFTLKLREPD